MESNGCHCGGIGDGFKGSSTPTAPIQRVSNVPDGVRPEEGELAAGLCDMADLHLKMSLKGKQLCMGGLVK